MAVNIDKITTERRNEKTKDIDLCDTLGILTKINAEDKTVPLAVEKALPQVASLVDQVVLTFEKGGRLVYVGAGTSGRLGVVDASECPPTFGVSQDRVVALIAGGESAFIKAVEGAEDSQELAIEDLKKINLNINDVLVGIAASGRTPYVVSAIKYANSIGVKTGCVTTSLDSEVAKVAKYPIEAVTGAEPITGSTRMKSGTAQKLVLNMITTTAMIKIGKIYENLMIDVQMTNEKLVSRAERIVHDITGVEIETAQKYLEKYKGVKEAIFAILTGIEDIVEINGFLNKNKGHLRKAIKEVLNK